MLATRPLTDAVLNGMPPHIAQLICGHHNLNTIMGYKALYPEEVINNHRSFIARRRALRPPGEYQTPTDEEWEEFPGHFVLHRDAGPAEVTACAGTARPTGHRWGTNVVGYFDAELGIGQSARLVVDAIEAAGGSCATNSWYRHYSRAGHKFRHRGQALGRYPFPIDVVCLNGDMLPYFAHEHACTFGQRYTVGFWHWELEERPPNYVRALDLLDEGWVGSEFTSKAVAGSTDKPVVTVPPTSDREGRPPAPQPGRGRHPRRLRLRLHVRRPIHHGTKEPRGRHSLVLPGFCARRRPIAGHKGHQRRPGRNRNGGHRWGPDGTWETHHTGWTPKMLHAELERTGFLVMNDDGDLNNT